MLHYAESLTAYTPAGGWLLSFMATRHVFLLAAVIPLSLILVSLVIQEERGTDAQEREMQDKRDRCSRVLSPVISFVITTVISYAYSKVLGH